MIAAGVRRGALVVGFTGGLAGVVLTLVMLALTQGRTVARSAGPLILWVMREHGELARCEADPPAWSIDIPKHSRLFAYDAATLESHNPAAPPLDRGLASGLGQSGMAARPLGFAAGGVVLVRVAPSGPCALVASRWLPIVTGRELLLSILGLGIAAGIASAAISVLLGVRPLVRRIASLRRAAARVGEREGYTEVEPGATDDLGGLARELDRAHLRIRSDTEEIERQKSVILRHAADVAHDLRTPIASLQLALEQAIRAGDDRTAARALLVRAAEDVVYLGGLVANLRMATELTDGWTHRPDATASLGETVERAVRRLGFLALEKGITLEVAVPELPVLAAADPIATEQAVANVVENAVLHGEPGGHVAVLLTAVPQDAFRITVLDDGPGVSPEDLARLGEREFRSDAARRRDGRGRGLGLSITREVCSRAGWTLAFERGEPVGLCVTIVGRRLAGTSGALGGARSNADRRPM